MNESKDTDTDQSDSTTRTVAKKGTAPTVTARRPISKEEYARTTKESADRTSVIPAITEDGPPPESEATKDAAAKPEVKAGAAEAKADAVKASGAAGVTAAAATEVKPAVTKPAASEPKKSVAPKDKAAEKAAKKAESSKTATAGEKPSGPVHAVPGSPAVTIPEPVDETVVQPAVRDDVTPEPQPETVSTLAKRRAVRRKLTYIDPWSVSKMAFVVSVALMIVAVVAVSVFWVVLQVTGVWEALNDSVTNVLSDGSDSFDVTNYVGLTRMVGFALVVSALNVVFMTALAMIAAHLYNMAASMLGGVEVTFEERE